MNLLGVDYGTKNIGLAKTNTAVSVVLPFGLIVNQDIGTSVQKLIQVVQAEKIDKIIVGLPLGLDGSENRNTKRVRIFFEEVERQAGAPVEFITEVFSSQTADRMGAGVSRDEKSAMVILQSYLDRK